MRNERELSPAGPTNSEAFETAASAPGESPGRDELLEVQESFRRVVVHKLSGTQGSADDVERRATWLVPVQ